MEKQIMKVMTIQLAAGIGIFALFPATDYFGMGLIQGDFHVSGSSLMGFAVYLSLLAYGGRLLFGDRLFVDPLRPAHMQPAPMPMYAVYLRRFGVPFIPGTRGTVQVTPQYEMTPELKTLGSRFEQAVGRKLDRLERKEDTADEKPDEPVLV